MGLGESLLFLALTALALLSLGAICVTFLMGFDRKQGEPRERFLWLLLRFGVLGLGVFQPVPILMKAALGAHLTTSAAALRKDGARWNAWGLQFAHVVFSTLFILLWLPLWLRGWLLLPLLKLFVGVSAVLLALALYELAGVVAPEWRDSVGVVLSRGAREYWDWIRSRLP